jgi:hypothetical protein
MRTPTTLSEFFIVTSTEDDVASGRGIIQAY